MQEFHPLTELIIDTRRKNEEIGNWKEDVEIVVREWLVEKGNELERNLGCGEVIDKILCLEAPDKKMELWEVLKTFCEKYPCRWDDIYYKKMAQVAEEFYRGEGNG